MLHVSARYFRDRSSFKSEQQDSDSCLVADVVAIADMIDSLPDISSHPGGGSGYKGWMLIAKDGLYFSAYFMDETITFEFFSNPEIEGGGYCVGEIGLNGFKNTVIGIDGGLFSLSRLRADAFSINFSPGTGSLKF